MSRLNAKAYLASLVCDLSSTRHTTGTETVVHFFTFNNQRQFAVLPALERTRIRMTPGDLRVSRARVE